MISWSQYLLFNLVMNYWRIESELKLFWELKLDYSEIRIWSEIIVEELS